MARKASSAKQDDPAAVARAEGLRQSADDSARLVRTLFFGFMGLGAYIAVIIAGTTDVQLLKIDPVRLPLLNVDIPIVGFYIAAPWLFVLAHFNLLLQFHLLARKLYAFEAALEPLGEPARADQRERLFPLAFAQMLASRQHDRLMRALLGLMVWASAVALPVALLIWAEIRFLPFQSTLWTGMQRAAVAAGIALLLIFWPYILTGDGAVREWWWRPIACGLRVVRVAAVLIRAGGRWLRPRRVWRAVAISRRWRRGWQPMPSLPRGGAMLAATILPVAAFYGLLVTDAVPFEIARRHLDLREQVLVRGDPPAEVVVALKEGSEEERKQALKRVLGLDLRERRLDGARLGDAVLPKADLRGATLTGADFTGAKFDDRTNFAYACGTGVTLPERFAVPPCPYESDMPVPN